MPESIKNQSGGGRDEGALSESFSIDYSISESAFWWPCGSDSKADSDTELGKLWMDRLFDIVIRPNNVESLVNLAAETTALIISKHLQLARYVVYSSIVASNGEDMTSIEAVTTGKPIITDLVQKLCIWDVVTTIPLRVHGALFETIGGISELLNGLKEQIHPSHHLQSIEHILLKYEAQTQQYLQRISEEVLLKGLANPFNFPVVSQHISVCYLSETNSVAQQLKRLIGHYTADKNRPTQVPSSLEAFLISVHRNAEAFLRGQLILLQSMRLYGFSHLICFPAVFQIALNAKTLRLSSHQATDTNIAAIHLLKLPILINDFLIAILTALYNPSQKLTIEIVEGTRVHCLAFGISFWKFWALVLQDTSVSSERVTGIISPLVECIARGSSSEKTRAAELLMMVLECLLKGNTRLNETTLSMIDSIKSEAAAIESKQSTDFGRMTKKFRQLDQNSSFFAKRSADPIKAKGFTDMTSRSKPKLVLQSKSAGSISRPIRKSAVRTHSSAMVDLSGIEKVSSEAAARKQHSFYSEAEYRSSSSKESAPKDQISKTKPSFDLAQVVKGIAQSHSGSNMASHPEHPKQVIKRDVSNQLQDEVDTEIDLPFAALFHRIKTTRKPIAICSLLPFYRQLLQTGMPVLLSGEFTNEQSSKELQVPSLSFKKSADYVRAFLPLMVEECHNEVQEGLRNLFSGNGGHLLRYESEKPKEGMRCINFSIVQKDERLLASSQSKFGSAGRKQYNEKLFRNGDVVLLQIAVGSENKADFMGKREILGVILVSEAEKGRRQSFSAKKSIKNKEEESVSVLFLNDSELDSATTNVRSFSTDVLGANAIADSEWKVKSLCNLITSAREYIALRSVDMLPEHLRTAILTPEAFKSTQSELITISSVLDELRGNNSSESCAKILKLLKRLSRMNVMLTDLRTTSIGKAVNKLRKHANSDIKALSTKLKERWTDLMDKTDDLECAPRFISSELWDALKPQYNSSQLQSIHSVLNNYSTGVSLLQGPPGTGKTKTIMGLLSGLLSLQLPATAVMPVVHAKGTLNAQNDASNKEFKNFEAARSRQVKVGQPGGQTSSPRVSTATFSLTGVTSALGSILRRSSDSSSNKQSRTSIQALKCLESSRDRLESKLTSRSQHSNSNLVVKRRIITRSASKRSGSQTNKILLCAPSNGAVNELVLRIVTDGLMDSSGKKTKVRAPSVHPEALLENDISIVRLGSAGEDATESVNSVCLPHIIRREMAIHPKSMELHALQDTQRQMRSSIRDFHTRAEEENGQKKDRKVLAKLHQQLTECSGKIRRLRDEVTAIRTKMTESILSKANIIACTLSKAGSGELSELKHGFDALIIDEAAQAVELSTLVPIRERVARVILVGDPKQLPATVKSVVAAKARYDRSLFERIAESGVASSMLRVQYRMHPFLREFPSKRFYGGMLSDGPSVMERVQEVCPAIYAHTTFQPFLLYDVENSREEEMNGSKYNRVEAVFCISLCQHMFERCADVRKNKWSVGFVSPYKEQVRVLRQEITRSKIPASVSIEVNTVDGFQGREKDVIVFSCVRSSKKGGIGFLRDIRRLNVAITRARFCLYVVGNVETLVRDKTWAALVKSARDRKLIINSNGEPFMTVAKRLESDKYRDLAEHYKQMHEKALRKVVLPQESEKVKAIKIENHERKLKEEIHDVNMDGDGVTTTTSVHQNEVKMLSDAKQKKEIDMGHVKSDFSPNLARDVTVEPSESQKRTRTEPFNPDATKKPRLSTPIQPTAADLQDHYKIQSFRDRNNSLKLSSEIHFSHNADTDQREPSISRDDRSSVDNDRRRVESPHLSTDKCEVQRDQSRISRYNRRSYDRSRDDRRNEGKNWSDNRSDGTNRRDHDNRARHSIENRKTPSPYSSTLVDAPHSISEKQFCQANEPPRSSTSDCKRLNARSNGKRRHSEYSHPPPHPSRDRVSSSKSSYRSATNEARHIARNTKNPTNKSTNVLSNILGSAKKLASSTSRVYDKSHPRSSEFS
ncbi:putative transcription factor IIS, P-loop containing nucleoside triphosphate hydrolase [Plasmopara halstedii]